MRKEIKVDLAGRSFRIHETAYRELTDYLNRVSNNLATNHDRTEIIDDVEARIADHFDNSKADTIDESQVNEMISRIGEFNEYDLSRDSYTKPGQENNNQTMKIVLIIIGAILVLALLGYLAWFLIIRYTLKNSQYVIGDTIETFYNSFSEVSKELLDKSSDLDEEQHEDFDETVEKQKEEYQQDSDEMLEDFTEETEVIRETFDEFKGNNTGGSNSFDDEMQKEVKEIEETIDEFDESYEETKDGIEDFGNFDNFQGF